MAMNKVGSKVSTDSRPSVSGIVASIVRTAGRGGLAATVGAAALVCAAPSWSQEAPADEAIEAAAPGEVEEMVITGTRVARAGYDAPTPVNIVTAEQIAVEAPANITDFVNTLPSIRGSTTPASTSGAVSAGTAGISALNLRALGTNRTLVLFDGQRSVVSAATGIVDVNTFPQTLIERVEVVTGGASSQYGSDAVGGVVNFILDKDYTGLKSDVEYGQMWDKSGGPNRKVNLTYGTPMFGDRGHLLLSGEYFNQRGEHDQVRDWQLDYRNIYQNSNAAIAAGAPRFVVANNVGVGQYTPGGLIVGGTAGTGNTFSATLPAALQNRYFGVNSTVNTFALGSPRTGLWQQGGDFLLGSSEMIGTNTLLPGEERTSGFGRFSYELANGINTFVQASYARYAGESFYIRPPSAAAINTSGVVTGGGSAARIRVDNPFLPTDVRTAMQAANLGSIFVSTNNADMPASGSNNVRSTQRFVAGLDSEFQMLGGKNFKWNAYYQRGETKADEKLINTWQNSALNNATDAVRNNAGNIVCRINADTITTNDDPNCVALNRLGVGVASQAALDYVLGEPRRVQTFSQDVAAVNLSTNEFQGWAGPISVATGIEWRRDKQDAVVDPIFNTGWRFGNYLRSVGEIKVTEGYVETVVPVMQGMDFTGAFRFTDYSTSGNVNTWKVGLSYQPIDDIKVRLSHSRDIRAPNLQELFAAGTARTNSADFTGIRGLVGNLNFVQREQGNLNVKPEEADAWGAGLVFTPQALPGFAASVDWYKVDLSGAIASFSVEQTIQACRDGVTRFCGNIISNAAGTGVDFVDLFFENQNTLISEGVDIESSYQFGLGNGQLQLRALGTHYMKNILKTATTAVNIAGSNVGNTPDWTYRFSALYKQGEWTSNVTVRGFSNGNLSAATAQYIECSSACPTTLPAGTFTVSDNSAPGAIYWDVSLTRAFEMGPTKNEFFFAIRNLFDKDPGWAGNPQSTGAENMPAYQQTNRTLYDFLGRTFRTGVRIRF
jgi:outer membrane receptor protein involved in Fe transport